MGRRGKGGEGTVHGVAVVDKEAGWTSHDVVAKARGLLGTRRVGHSGTLDPDATGVLVLGVGRATKLLRFLQLLFLMPAFLSAHCLAATLYPILRGRVQGEVAPPGEA